MTITPVRQELCSPSCPQSVWQILGNKNVPFRTSQVVQGLYAALKPHTIGRARYLDSLILFIGLMCWSQLLFLMIAGLQLQL